MEENMTAIFSLFIRSYHIKTNKYKLLKDNNITKLISEEEYNQISENLINGVKFFDPNFEGTREESLNHVMSILSPSVLGREIYINKMLLNDIRLGCKQYIMLGSGYDICNISNIKVFEVDKSSMIDDKIKRVNNLKVNNSIYIKSDLSKNNFVNDIKNNIEYDTTKKTFCSMLGLTYYLTKEEFNSVIKELSNLLNDGDTIIFDYPVMDKLNKIELLANASGNTMKSKYSIKEINSILDKYNFLIYENLNHNEIDKLCFYDYNTLNPSKRLVSPSNVFYCMAVKKSVL